MLTKTIKLKEGEYTEFKDEFKEHDLVILTGARGSGKSYPVAKHVSRLLIENPESKFIYMRIHKDELATFSSWCLDMDLNKIAENAFSVELKRGQPTRGDIKLYGYDEDGSTVFERVIGKCISLENSHMYKSGKYDEFDSIVFEEYTHLNMNPETEKNYVFNFLENITSIFRSRKKSIFLMCNNLKTIPLLERAIDDLTDEMFANPLKIKIFRASPVNSENKFLAYLNGELYSTDNFRVNLSEFFIIYSNKDYMIMQHKVYNRKHYICANTSKKKINYREAEFLTLKFFCRSSSVNEYYYQNKGVELAFVAAYFDIISEVTAFTSVEGGRYIT